jgi:hypothetical protein
MSFMTLIFFSWMRMKGFSSSTTIARIGDEVGER